MRTELGQVYYLTVRVIMPGDNELSLRQIPIPGASTFSIMAFIERLKINKDKKSKLCKDLECSWKEHGIWHQLVIERTRRNPVTYKPLN